MKKLFVVCLILTLASLFTPISWSGYRSLKGDDVRVYTRFFEQDTNGVHFNWLGLLSPIQTETQKIIFDTIKFNHKVIYPYGKNFKCVEPDGIFAENFVAGEIFRTIQDSIEKIQFNTSLDYDGQLLSVRQSANPSNRKIAKPAVILSLFGTASPEARKYGFLESILPGHEEYENDTLAQARLNRTALILEGKGLFAKTKDFAEVQFSDTATALTVVSNPAILDSMRYVLANVIIPIQRLEVTPATSPVFFPFWLWFIALGLMYLWRLRLPKIQRPKFEWGPWSWGGPLYFLKMIAYCIAAALALTALIMFINWKWVLIILAILVVFGIACLVLWYIDEINNAIVNFFLWVLGWVVSFFLFIWDILISIWKFLVSVWKWITKTYRYLRMRFGICWKALQPCWRRVFIFGLIYSVIMTALVIYLI